MTPTDPKECKHHDDGFCTCFPTKERSTYLRNGNRTTRKGKSCAILVKQGDCPDFTTKTEKDDTISNP